MTMTFIIQEKFWRSNSKIRIDCIDYYVVIFGIKIKLLKSKGKIVKKDEKKKKTINKLLKMTISDKCVI